MKIITFNKNGTTYSLHIIYPPVSFLGQFHALIQFSSAEYASDAKMVRIL